MSACSCNTPTSPMACVTSSTPIAMLPEYAGRLCEQLSKPATPIATQYQRGAEVGVTVGELSGVITPQVCRELREWASATRRDSAAERAILRIDSPGGIAVGCPEAADALYELAKIKPLIVFAEGYLCSAAYMLASQATEIVASRSAWVGSCGTIVVLTDDSAMYEAAGVKVIPVTTGRAKQIGLPGVPLSDEDVDRVRREIESSNEEFKATVRRRKQLSTKNFEEVFRDADTYKARRAKELGLIDRIGTFEDEVGEAVDLLRESRHLDITEHEAADQFLAIADRIAANDKDDSGTGWGYAHDGHYRQAKQKHPRLFDRAVKILRDRVRDHADLSEIL